MSLTGNLEIFPMQEVLRLLSRSKKSGCLRIDTGSVEGRVYLTGGAITYANTESDDAVRRALLNSGIVTEDGLRSISGNGGSLADALSDGADQGALSDFVREQVVESLYRIRKPGHGDFDFAIDLSPVYQTGQTFDTDVAVAESDRRAGEWDDILSVIADLDSPVRMVQELPDDNSVTIAAATWKVLAALAGGISIRDLAFSTGMSEFRTARELSGLMRSDLVEIAESRAPSFESNYQAPVIERASSSDESGSEETFDSADSASDSAWEAPSWENPVDETVEGSTFDTVEDEVTEDTDGADSSSSWFDEAVTEESESFEASVDVEASTDDDSASDSDSDSDSDTDSDGDSDGGWWSTAVDTPSETTDGIDSDPDSFLESVFSQLNDDTDEDEATNGEEATDETGFSMGLLRRRRMGAAARDITEG